MKTLKINTLDKCWCDRDDLLLHASFQILVDFVEKEEPGKIIDWNCNKEYKRIWKEITSLYKWWKKIRPARKSPLDDKRLKYPPFEFKNIKNKNYTQLVFPNKKKYAKFYKVMKKDKKLEQRWDKEDNQNLHRLINIRKDLWT